ncbi:hypothetical protein [Pontibacter sp. H249]|uniref:hypothetical protein n=1 Tax=Pontibacter sp. H249 TaxID=3133420 RepID=UPI0030C40E19
MRKQALLILFLLFAFVCQAQTVYKTKTGAKYHVQTCRYLKSSFETTVAKAQAEGLTACSVCRPPAVASGTSATPVPAVQAAPALKSTDSSGSSSSGSRSSTGSVQCSGTTKAGARCKRMTTSASGRCYQH